MSVVANVAINVDSRNAVSNLQQFEQAAKRASASVGMLVASLGAGLAFGQLIKSASQFESQLSEIGKTASASEKEIANLAVALQKLSAPSKTNLAPSILAEGVKDLVAQGLKLDDAVASMETLGKVAVATNSELTDVTKTGFQLQSALKIKPTELKETFDALAFAGKAGAFELKDMAQFMPTIASAATSIGITGKKGAVALAAMMQMVRKDAPGAAEASTRLTDALLKMTAPDAVKNFAKFGVNIEQVLKNAVAKGVNPMDAALKELQRVTGGDAFKLSQIFGDKEAKLALMSLMKYREEYEKLKAAAGGGAAAGTVQADFEASLETFNGKLQTLQTSGEILALSLGNTLLPILARLIQEILPIVNGVAQFAQGMGQIPQPAIDAAIGIGKVVIQLLLIDKALKIAMATTALFRGAMLLLTTQTTLAAAAGLTGQARLLMLAGGIQGAGVAAATAAPLVAGLKVALLGLAAIGIISVGINLITTGLGEFIAAQTEINRLRGLREGGGVQLVGGATQTRENVIAQQKTAKATLAASKAKFEKAQKFDPVSTVLGTIAPLFGGKTASTRIGEMRLAKEEGANAQAVLGLSPSAFQPAKPVKPEVPITAGGGVTPTDGGGGGKGDDAAKKLEAEAKKRAEEAARLKASLGVYGIELGLKRQIYDIDNKIFVASLEKDKETQIRLKGEKELLRVNSEIAKVEFESLTPQERTAKLASLAVDEVMARRDTMQELLTLNLEIDDQAEAALETLFEEGRLLQSKLQGKEQEYQKQLLINKMMKENPTLIRSEVEALVSKNEALKGQMKAAEELKSLYSDIGMSIKDGVVDAIQGAIDGTKSLQEVASNLLQNIANKLIDVAVNMALFGAMSGTGTGGGLLGGLFGGGKAAGGPVSSNSTYMVGEKGPELFVPSTAGTIIPADATAAMARYQRQGGGSGSGNSSSDAMGDGAAATPVLSMSFETTRFLGQDYVSTDQLQAAMMATEKRAAAAGAKAGAAQVTSKLQQSPSYRRQVGLR